MKKIASILTLTVLSLLFLLTNVHAEGTSTTTGTPVTTTVTETVSTTTTVSPTPTTSNKLLTETQTQQARLKKAIAFADSIITKRIDSITKYINQIKASSVGTTSSSQTLIASLNADIASLTGLKAQIDAMTDPTQVATAIADAKTVFTNYRVYQVEIPQAHGLMHLQELASIVTNFTTISKDMTQDIAYATSQSVSTTTIQADATAFNTDLAKLNTDIATATAYLNGLTPASYASKGNVIDQIGADFKAIHTDVQNCKKDFEKFKTDFLELFHLSASTTPTVTPTE